jgi:hypothetical protein
MGRAAVCAAITFNSTPSTIESLAVRRLELGSSDAPVVMGCSPHKTPFQLWLECVGAIERKDEPTEVMEYGTLLEQTILAAYCCDMGWSNYLPAPTTTLYHYDRVWQRSTPDGVVLNEYGSPCVLLEVKCVVGHAPPAPRVDWVVQALHHLLVREEATECHILAFGNLMKTVWPIPYHLRAMDRVRREEEAFLERVEKEDPPPVSGRDASILNKAWPLLSEEVITLGPETVALDRLWTEARVQIAAWKEIQNDAEARIKDAIGPHTAAVLPDGSRYTWREQSRKGHVVAAGTTRVLRRT